MRILGRFCIGFGLFFLFACRISENLSTEPLGWIKLPSSEWAWGKPGIDPVTTRIIYPVKAQQAVNIYIYTAPAGDSAKDYLERDRGWMVERKAYQGAEVRLLETRKLGKTIWDVYQVRRKDGLAQEIWARKTSKRVVFYVMYTGRGGAYQEYYPAFQALMESLSEHS